MISAESLLLSNKARYILEKINGEIIIGQFSTASDVTISQIYFTVCINTVPGFDCCIVVTETNNSQNV